MELRKTTRAALATLLVAGACISAPASAHGNVVRDILLAPLLVPAAIASATLPPVVVAPVPLVHAPARVGYRAPRQARLSHRADHRSPPQRGNRRGGGRNHYHR
jgi:hypothetical protein